MVFQGRLKTALAITTIAAIAALFALLFYGFVGHGARITTRPSSNQITASPASEVTGTGQKAPDL